MSVQISFKKQFLILIIISIIVLLVIEGFVRFYDYITPSDDCYFVNSDAAKNIPYEIKKQSCLDFRETIFVNYPFKIMLPNQHFPTININEYGFRGSEITKEKPDNTYRIFMVGGSTTFGTGSTSDQTTIPGFLQKKFDSLGLPFDVQVVNAGFSGGNSISEVWLIKNRILEFEPDLLIIYDGYNDVYYIEKENNNFTKDNDFDTQMINFQKIFDETFLRILSSYKTLDKIVEKVEKSKTDFDNPKKENPKKYKMVDDNIRSNKISAWKEHWKEICQVGKEKGYEVIVTIQPILGSSDRELSKQEKNKFILWENEKRLVVLEDYANSLNFLEDYCYKTADLRKVFDDINRPIYTDNVHMSDFGNEIVANEFFEISLPIVKNSFLTFSVNFNANRSLN